MTRKGEGERGWVTEADSDARSFFIIFKPPWSNLTLETVPSKSIRCSAFSLFPPSPSFPFLPFFLSRRAPYIARDESPANQVDSFHPAQLACLISTLFFTRPCERFPSTQREYNKNISRTIQSRLFFFSFFLSLSLSLLVNK